MIPPDEIEDYCEINERIIELFKEFDFTPVQALVVLTSLTCIGYQSLERTKDSFLEEMSKIWDAVE